jgi:hypothetical protein
METQEQTVRRLEEVDLTLLHVTKNLPEAETAHAGRVFGRDHAAVRQAPGAPSAYDLRAAAIDQ